MREISAEILAAGADMEPARVRELFGSGSGYQTPKLDTRAAIFEGDRILLVRERDGRWALPGGWVDVGLSIAENAVKEVREEAGLEVEAVKLIALQEHNRHNRPARAEGICTAIRVLCRRLGGEFQPNIETTGSAYFAIDELPELAEDKTTAAQIRLCFAARSDQLATAGGLTAIRPARGIAARIAAGDRRWVDGPPSCARNSGTRRGW